MRVYRGVSDGCGKKADECCAEKPAVAGQAGFWMRSVFCYVTHLLEKNSLLLDTYVRIK